MTQDNSQEADVQPENVEETEEVQEVDYSKELQKSAETIGSLKRELKDLKKILKESQEPSQEVSKETNNFGLSEKALLKAYGVSDEEEVELARKIQKQTGMPWDELVDDEYFESKLKQHRNYRSNAFAATGIETGGGDVKAKFTPQYWLQKGVPPTREQVPDTAARRKIARAFIANAKKGKTFYND